jgi:signal peptidase II
MPFVYIAVIAAAFAADRLVKLWAAGPLVSLHGGSLPLIEGVFHFTYAENRGAAFSMLQGQKWLLIGVTGIICLVGLYFLFFSRRRLPVLPSIAIALALGGALGNLYDRIFLGYVIDMLDFCLINFAVFNVADSCVNVGVVLLAIWMIFFEEKDKKKISWRWGAPGAAAEGMDGAEDENAGNTAEGDKGR